MEVLPINPSNLAERLKRTIRDVPDFPKPGIVFKDIAPVTADANLMREVVDHMTARCGQLRLDSIVAIESRGFIFGAPLAYALKLPLHMARKQGKLPYATVARSYNLEYGTATIELHVDAVSSGDRVLVIDDLLATGGTAQAVTELVEQQGGIVVECSFLIELAFLAGRDRLGNRKVSSLVRYE